MAEQRRSKDRCERRGETRPPQSENRGLDRPGGEQRARADGGAIAGPVPQAADGHVRTRLSNIVRDVAVAMLGFPLEPLVLL
jgi:hypothetical protein